MPRKRSYTDRQLFELVPLVDSFRSLCRKLELAEGGAGYTNLQKVVKRLEIDTSHFVRKKLPKNKTDLQDVFSNSVYLYSSHLKKRMIKEGYFEEKCYRCERTEWEGQRIPLELEHINGKSRDNSLDNLTLLCPNCHALTNTYRGRNIGNK